jgi:hypothetical protein
MTSDPGKAASKVDIKNLLNLLNASEDAGAASAVLAEIIDEPKLPKASPLASLKKLVAANVENQMSADAADARNPDSLENPHVLDHIDHEFPQDDPENRFAAHIVHGMSKLKRE